MGFGQMELSPRSTSEMLQFELHHQKMEYISVTFFWYNMVQDFIEAFEATSLRSPAVKIPKVHIRMMQTP